MIESKSGSCTIRTALESILEGGDPMSRTLHLRVYVGVSVDLNALWEEIRECKGAHLSGDSANYIINYDGEQTAGLKVLSACLEHADCGKFYADFS